MKKHNYLIISLSLGIISIAWACSHSSKASRNNYPGTLYDSVSVSFFEIIGSEPSKRDDKGFVMFYQLIRGMEGNDYNLFYFEAPKDIGKSYRFLYKNTNDKKRGEMYDVVDMKECYSETAFKLDSTFTLLVNNTSYSVNKYRYTYISSGSCYDVFSGTVFHYLNDELGLLAVENPSRGFWLVDSNSRKNDSIYSNIRNQLYDMLADSMNKYYERY